MLPFLLRRWFLLLLAVGLALAVLRPDWVRPISDRLPLRPLVALTLFLTAWSLAAGRLWRAVGRPGSVLAALAISFVCLPGFAFLAGPLLPQADLALGLLIIASVPCTLSSAVLWTRQAGGDEAMALLIVLLTNAMGWMITPLWLAGAGAGNVELDAWAMMRSLVMILVVPVVLGQAVRLAPGVAAAVSRHHTLNSVAARLLVAVVLICAAADGAAQADRMSVGLVAWTAVVCVALHLAGVFLGLVGGRLLGVGRPDRIAVAFAGSQKTLPVGLVVFGMYYRDDYPLAVLPLLLYHAGQLLADTIVADNLAADTNLLPEAERGKTGAIGT